MVANSRKDKKREKYPLLIRLSRILDFPIMSLFIFLFEWYILTFVLDYYYFQPLSMSGTDSANAEIVGPLLMSGLFAFLIVEVEWAILVRTRSSYNYLDYTVYCIRRKGILSRTLSSRNSIIRGHLTLIRRLGNWKSDFLFDEQMKIHYKGKNQDITNSSEIPSFHEMVEAIMLGISFELLKEGSYSSLEPYRKYADSYSQAIRDDGNRVATLIKFITKQYKSLPDSVKFIARESPKKTIREKIGEYTDERYLIAGLIITFISVILSWIFHV